MNPSRKRTLLWIVFSLGILAVVTALVTYALRQNISLFYTPTQVLQTPPPATQKIRLGGMVEQASVTRVGQGLSVQFKVTDLKSSIVVHYRGILPDLFREGQGIVVFGSMSGKSSFKATEVLAKHDANYMPPQVKSALALQKANLVLERSALKVQALEGRAS